MLHILVIRYTASARDAAPHVDDHTTYLDRNHAAGTFLLSGPTVPDHTGSVILARGDRAGIEAITAEDPFVRAGVARYEILTVDAGRLDPALAALLAASPGEEPGAAWDRETLLRIRGDNPDLGSVLEGKPLGPVLQQAGQALLTSIAHGASTYADTARRCASELRRRGWAGDSLLADALEGALGERSGTVEHRTDVAVEIDDLAEALDGDPSRGEGGLDTRTGEVLPPELLQADLGDDAFDDDDAEDHMLWFTPDSGDAYRDMLDFAGGVADDRLRDRLLRALDGKGAFRRFRDALADAGEAESTRWSIVRNERALGRARQWLDDQGYRPRS